MTRVWIVRHGNTFEPGAPSRRIGARTDLPLVASGQAQADTLRRWFATEDITFDRVLAGPLRRTLETARRIAPMSVPETSDTLLEIDHGPDEDRLEAEVVTRIGRSALAAWDEGGVPPPDWKVDAEARVAGWRALLDTVPDGQNVLAVTSNGAARFALSAGVRVDAPPASLKLRTGAWGLLVRQRAAVWRLAEWDRRPGDL